MQTLAKYFVALLIFLFSQFLRESISDSDEGLAEQCTPERVEVLDFCIGEHKEAAVIV